MLALKLLGGARVETDQGRVAGRSVQRHQIALMALLATAPGYTLSRDKLIGLLWPERDTKHARNLLNVSVYAIRQMLSADALLSTGDGIELNIARWRVDVMEFDAALSAGELERATRLYTGPFLDGFFLDEASEFDRWQTAKRDRLERRYAGALQTLANDAEANGDTATAIDWWHRLAAHDPLDSHAALSLMRALARSGNRAAAVQHGHAHSALLRAELGVEPSSDVAAFAATLSADTNATSGVPSEPSPTARPAADVRALPSAHHPLPPGRSTAEFDKVRTRGRSGSRMRKLALLSGAGVIVLGASFMRFRAVAGDTRYGGEAPASGASAAAATAIPSIAVLPFLNVGGDTANAYFADGLAEEVTAALQRVPGLRVLSQRSAFAFRDSAGMDVRRIGQRLGVGAVLEGTTRRLGTRLRVTAQVTSVRDGRALWSETYERDRKDGFSIQDEIARSAAGALRLTVDADRGSLALAGTKSVDAHELYLHGRFLFNNAQSEQSLRQSIAFYEQAIAVDRNYALAWAGIADAWAMLADWYVAPNDAYPRAKTAALTALAIDSALAEAHAILGAVQAAYDWDFAAADRSAGRAMALSPNSANALAIAMWPHLASGDLDSAVSVIQRARALDPLSAATGYFACWALTAAHRYDAAIREARKMLAVNAQEPLAFWAMGDALSAQGRHAEALGFFERAAPIGPMPRLDLARTLAALGRRDEALRLVGVLEREAERRYVSPGSIAMVYVYLGDHDAAFRRLEHAYRLRSAQMTSLRYHWAWDPVRNDPRFQAIVRRIWGAG